MMEQLLEASRGRYDLNEEIPSNSRCFVIGMDQGLHNWLLHSGRLRRLMKVKVFSQGEGPVNTIGAFYPGDRALLRLDLEKDWKILKGSVNQRYIANWNNDPSPVVHQYDRFE